MRKLLFIIPLGLSLTAMSCSNNTNETNTDEVIIQVKQEQSTVISKDVNVVEFAELIQSDKGQILDVRTPEEWAEGTIKGATKMNFFDANFDTQLSQLDKTQPVYVYCKSGGRSGKATKKMKKMGFTIIYNLEGGITAWKEAGKKTTD